ncbi:MAG: Metallophosphoesterase [uncultured Sulfurovum sp.]|uniref:Metallophosphoesterase n=1 Tax=uncultured Sulfurovum sp. TaxID=269237 RepID=A0A6S6SEM9_9BACT|nr:MAG: Metallophosphoesterase [uncultured Sulfurovum sp.]
MKLLIFALIFSTVMYLLNFYIIKRFINKLHIDEKYKRYFKIFLIINFVGILGYIYGRYNPDIPNWLFLLLSLAIGIIFLTFSTAVIYDLLQLFINKAPIEENRRAFLKRGLDYFSVATAVGLSGRAMYEATHIVIEQVEVKLKNLKQPYSIVQLSDVHIGGIIDQVSIKDMVEKTNVLKPDLVVITGDLVDIALKYALPALNELKGLKSTYGTYFIVGNHEYLHNVEEIIVAVNALGIKTLENESVYIGQEGEGFNLAGVYDHMGYRREHHEPNLKKALLKCDKNSPTVLLAHQPLFIKEVKSGVDLVLSGHTHGGQLYPFKALVKIVQPYLAGLYQHNEATQIYVNRGTGFWGPPMRLGASSEITHMKIS